MKTSFKLMFLFLALGLMVSCKKNTKGDTTKTGDAKTEAAAPSAATTFDVAEGTITWTGGKPTGDTHMGTINVSKGQLAVKDNNIASGEFTIDMNSLTNTDQEPGKGKEKLEGHLKSGDFFEVGKFPEAKFAVSSVKVGSTTADMTHEVTGNLTIKGITKSISFPVNVGIAGKSLTVQSAPFKINRTEWDVKFNSGILGTAKDMLINDDVSILISLAAKAK